MSGVRLYMFVNFGATSEIRGNLVVTDRRNPSRGLYFRNVTTPFEFEFSNNRDSFEVELLPTSRTAFYSLGAQTGGIHLINTPECKKPVKTLGFNGL